MKMLYRLVGTYPGICVPHNHGHKTCRRDINVNQTI